MPEYEGKVVFVNAITDDPSAQQLASKFQFQYIPTSFFITPDGKVSDSFTGSMPDTDMKARLDKLIGSVNIESLAPQLTDGSLGLSPRSESRFSAAWSRASVRVSCRCSRRCSAT